MFGLTPRGSREQVFFPIKQNKLSHTSVTFAVKYLNYYSKTIYFEVSSSFCLENKILENILFRNLGKICEIFMHRNSLFSKDKVFAYNQRSIDDFKIGKETFTEEGGIVSKTLGKYSTSSAVDSLSTFVIEHCCPNNLALWILFLSFAFPISPFHCSFHWDFKADC